MIITNLLRRIQQNSRQLDQKGDKSRQIHYQRINMCLSCISWFRLLFLPEAPDHCNATSCHDLPPSAIPCRIFLTFLPHPNDHSDQQFYHKLSLAMFSRLFPMFFPSSTRLFPSFFPCSHATVGTMNENKPTLPTGCPHATHRLPLFYGGVHATLSSMNTRFYRFLYQSIFYRFPYRPIPDRFQVDSRSVIDPTWRPKATLSLKGGERG